MKRLDAKLARLRTSYRPADFIIADAKDGDMGFGTTAPGPSRDTAGQAQDASPNTSPRCRR